MNKLTTIINNACKNLMFSFNQSALAQPTSHEIGAIRARMKWSILPVHENIILRREMGTSEVTFYARSRAGFGVRATRFKLTYNRANQCKS